MPPTKELAFPDDLFDISDLTERHNVLIYGPPGIGKSVLAGGAGMIIAVEPSGPVSAKRMGSKAKVWPAPSWEPFEAAIEWLETTYEEGHRPFEWLAIDTANAMQQCMLRWILENEQAKAPGRDIDKPEIQDHFKWQQMFKRFILRINDLPLNVLYLASEIRTETDEGDELRIPLFDGKARQGFGISSWVCAQMDAVGYMDLEEVTVGVKPKGWKEGEPLKKVKRTKRRIQFGLTADKYAKDRSGNCAPYVDDATLQMLHEKMMAPPKAVKPMPLAGVAERTDAPRRVASEPLGALPAGSTTAEPAETVIEDAEVIEDIEDDE